MSTVHQTMPARESAASDTASSRARLLAAAKRLMAEEGFERVSTAAIAREAGTSESQLVRYFGSKAGLLEAVFNESWAALNPHMAALVAAAASAREAILALLATMIGVFDRDPELARLLFFESRRLRGEHAEIRLSQGFQEFAALVLRLIERGQKDSGIDRTLRPAAVASALLGAAEGMIRDRLLAAQQRRPAPFSENQIRAVFAALLKGLGPPG